MDTNAEKMMIKYMSDILNEPTYAKLNVEEFPADLQKFASELKYFGDYVQEVYQLACAMAQGEMETTNITLGHKLNEPLLTLQMTLKSITEQAILISSGDYSKRIEIMDDYAAALNVITDQLEERQAIIDEDFRKLKENNTVIEQFSMVITSLLQRMPQHVFVIGLENHDILFMNEIALMEMHMNHEFAESIIELMKDAPITASGMETEVAYRSGNRIRYFSVRADLLEWYAMNAVIYIMTDISDSKHEMINLETKAYTDELTGLYNRAFGMKTLEEWLDEKRRFVLLFADLDSLKYINDEFGHNDGDMYIKNAAKHLLSFPSDSIVCRLGGDEYMALINDVGYDEVEMKTAEIFANLAKDEYVQDKEYSYSISFGFVAVDSDNRLPSAEILHTADERMYENKRARKKARIKELSDNLSSRV